MKPVKLSLTNFLSHENTVIDFTNMDAICLYGSNGSGKTSVIDGILFALYGQTSRGSDDALIRLGTDKMSVEFIFDIEGNIYKIEKSKVKNQTKQCSLYCNDKLVATGSQVDDYIESLIGLNYNTFTSTYFLLQDSAYKFITATPAERYKILFDILGLDIYQEYKKQASLLKRDSENNIKHYQQIINEKSSVLDKDKDIHIMIDELAYYEDKLSEVRQFISEKEKIYLDKERLLSESLNFQKEISRLNNLINDIEISISQSRKKIEIYKDKLSLKQEIENAVSEKKYIEQESKRILEEERELMNLYDNIKKEYNDLVNDEKFYIKEIEKLEGNIKETTAEKQGRQNIINNYLKVVSLLDRIPCGGEGEFSKCELIQNAIQAKNQLPELQQSLMNLEKITNNLQSTKETLQSDLQKILSQKEKIIQESKSYSEKINLIHKQKEQIINQIERINKKIEMLPDVLQAEKGIEVESENLNKLLQQKSEIEQNLKQLSENVTNLADIQREINQLKAEIHDLKQIENDTKNKIIDIKTQISIYEQTSKEIDELNNRIQTEQENLQIYTILEDAYDKIPKLMFNNYISVIEENANDILSKISTNNMQVELITEKQTKTTKTIKNTLEISVSDIVGERKIENFSGGEKTRLTLAFTVALSELVSGKTGRRLKTLVIDEPPGLDSQGFKDFAECIKQLINIGVFNVCMVISHSGELIEEFDYKIRFEKNNAGSSRIYIENGDKSVYPTVKFKTPTNKQKPKTLTISFS